MEIEERSGATQQEDIGEREKWLINSEKWRGEQE